MRIAEVAPMYEAVPPSAYGGTERVIAALCDGLVTIGHDVTLFAAAGSHTAAALVPTTDAPLRTRMSRAEMTTVAPRLHLDMLADVYRRARDFDVIHAHTDIDTLPFASATPTPTVLTLHGRLDLPRARRELRRHPEVRLVSISRHQRGAVADLPLRWAATVPNGLDLRRYLERAPIRGDYVVFVGRLNPEKRPDLAIEVARRSGMPLVIAAKVDPLDLDYFHTTIEPHLDDPRIRFVGEADENDKPALYGNAAATLFPSDWPEPFGLVMIESLAAGTPVIALRRGAVPEVISDGVHGFICDDVDGMVAAVDRLCEIEPAECRRRSQRFGAGQMTARYLEVFEAAVAGTAARAPSAT